MDVCTKGFCDGLKNFGMAFPFNSLKLLVLMSKEAFGMKDNTTGASLLRCHLPSGAILLAYMIIWIIATCSM